MAVQSISPEDLSWGLPPVIGLPRCLPTRPAYRKTPLGEVMVADELPPYLLLGTLDRSAFQCSDSGWTARWIGDVPETYVEAKFERVGRRLELQQVWRGIEGGKSFTAGDDFGHAIQLLYLPFPATWDQAMAERLEAAYGLKYFGHRADEAGFTGIPDGGFKTICVPVPIRRLADLYQCFEDMSCDARLKAPLSGRLELRFSTINYVVGQKPGVDAGSRAALYRHVGRGWPAAARIAATRARQGRVECVDRAASGVPGDDRRAVCRRRVRLGATGRARFRSALRSRCQSGVGSRVRCVGRVERHRAAGPIGRVDGRASDPTGVLSAQLRRGTREGWYRPDDGGDVADGGGGPGAD